MNRLETTFVKDNHTFTQVKRNDKAALYRREDGTGKFVSFEVFGILSKNGTEVYPNDKAFGVWAWCPITESKANSYFDRITKGETNIPNVDPETGDLIPLENDPSLEEVMNQADPIAETPVSVPVGPTSEVPLMESDPTAPVAEPVSVSVQPTPDDGAVVTVATVTKTHKPRSSKVNWIIPPGLWTAAEFSAANNIPVRHGTWSKINRLVEAGKVRQVEMRKVGKGRSTAFYSKV